MPRNLFKRSALSVALLCALGAQAQSLQALYEAAKTHDSTYLAARAQNEATLARIEQSNLLPTIALSASVSRSNIDPLPGTTVDRTYGSQVTALSATQPIYKPATWAAYQQAQTLNDLARAQLEQAEQDLIVRVSQAYFDVLTAQDNLTLVKAQKTANAEQLASAKRNFEVGTATITDTHEAQARHDLALAQEIAAENDLSIKRLALSTVVGLPAATPKALTKTLALPELKPSDMQTWVDRALSTHPSIEQAQNALNVAQLEVDKASAGHKPTLEGVLSYGATHNTGGTASSTTTANSRSNSASVGLNFNLPLFAGFATQARVRETLALEEKARTDLESTRRAVSQNTRSAFLNVLSGKSQVKALEAAQASSQSALEANLLGYQVGVRVNIDVLNAQSQLYQTRRDLAKARYDLLMADLKLRQAGGVLKPQDLSTINALLDK